MDNTKTLFRTHSCGELRMEQVGQTVTLAGFLENFREVGSTLGFAVLRDFYGTTQVVCETEEMVKTFKTLHKETTVAVTGAVRERDSKNPNLPTGDIEIVPTKVEVLGKCHHNELPFQINRSREADETVRLKHRYLDLRNPEVKKNIILRCQGVAAIRAAMTEKGFLEITTPSSPPPPPRAPATIWCPPVSLPASSTLSPRLPSRSSRCG